MEEVDFTEQQVRAVRDIEKTAVERGIQLGVFFSILVFIVLMSCVSLYTACIHKFYNGVPQEFSINE